MTRPTQSAPYRLSDYVVVVTGAAGGVGREVCRLLRSVGATVVATDLEQEGKESGLVELDVTDPDRAAEVCAEVISRHERIDALVHCAGILGHVMPTVEMSLEEFRRVCRINLEGAFVMTTAVLPSMVRERFGRILLLASVAGKEGNPQMAAYSASKSGVIGFAKSVGKEYARAGVTVNVLTPAGIDTPLLQGMSAERRLVQEASIPMGRFATPAEAASMIAFAISPECSFTTGHDFDLSGGRADY